MKQLNKSQVIEKLTVPACIDLMRRTLADYSAGKSLQYLRTVTPLPHHNLFGFMPAYLGDGDYFGAKVITVFHGNHEKGLPSHQGSVLLFDSESGSLHFMADGDAITMIRTGAVSAVATDLLARPDASHLCILGCGAQGKSHLRAISQVRKLTKITVWDKNPAGAEAFAREMADVAACPILPCPSAKEAVVNADIICTVTPSPVPVLEDEWVKPGAHINAVGACAAANRELPSALVARAKLYGDSVESVEKESGDYLIPLAEGLISKEHLLGTVGDLLLGKIEGRTDPDEVTVFDALGLAIEDVACAKYLYLLEE